MRVSVVLHIRGVSLFMWSEARGWADSRCWHHTLPSMHASLLHLSFFGLGPSLLSSARYGEPPHAPAWAVGWGSDRGDAGSAHNTLLLFSA